MADEERTKDDRIKEREKVVWTLPLRKAILAHGEELKELRFREPTAADILRYGLPVLMRPMGDGGIQVVTDEQKMTAMISGLLAIPPSSVAQLNTRDWSTAATWLASFFLPDWEQLRME